MKNFDILNPKTPILGNHFLEASAGTGKTFAIEHLVARLIKDEGFVLDEILVITFTRAAVRELKIRIRQTLKEGGIATLFDRAQIFTIHGFCYRMLTEYAFEAKQGFDIFKEEVSDYRQLLKKYIVDFLRTSLLPEEYSTSQLTTLLRKYRQNILIEKIASIAEKEGGFPPYPDFTTSYKRYLEHHFILPFHRASSFNKICNRSGAIKEPWDTQLHLLALPHPSPREFDLLISCEKSVLSLFTEANLSKRSKIDPSPFYKMRNLLLPILNEASSSLHTLVRISRACAHTALEKGEIFSPDAILKKMSESLAYSPFLFKIRNRYRAVIIDEFQDTDTMQWQIIKTLFVDYVIPALYLVGDPKQSIYSFRNADIYTYLDAKKTISNTLHLETNYRSDPALIRQLNALFSQKPNWLSFPQNLLPFHPVKYRNIANTSFPDNKTAVHFFAYETEKRGEKSWPSPTIEKRTFFPFIANEIQALTQKGFHFSDFAILVKDRYQAERLKNFLETHSIPTLFKTTRPLVETASYTLIYYLLQAYFDPTESSIKRFLAHPLQPYSYRDLQDERFLTQMINTFRAIPSLHSTLFDLFHPKDLETYSDFLALTELVLEHPENPLSYLDSLPNTLCCPLFDPNSVTITTIHMSKGLEFNIVFALGLINRYTGYEELIHHKNQWFLFDPDHPQSQMALQHQQSEKMRQLYVALTRAKKRVYIPLLIDRAKTPIPPGQESPMELFQPTPQDVTYLDSHHLPPQKQTVPPLHPPQQMTQTFPCHFLHSYSSLSHPHSRQPPTVESALPKGYETGILLHSLLEMILDNDLPDSVIPALLEEHLPPHMPFDVVHTMIHHALHIPLSPHTFTLRDIPSRAIHTEVEFLYPENKNFIKGVVDLVFSHKNNTYILDWKTTILADYSPSSLTSAMKQLGYDLQSQLYHTALSRYLFPTPISGTYYIFLRALPHSGILFLPDGECP